jgi:hypothetical protein
VAREATVSDLVTMLEDALETLERPSQRAEPRQVENVAMKNTDPRWVVTGVVLVWHNVSGDDGDPNDGQFVFTVAGAPAATPTPVPTATPSTANTATQPVAPVTAAAVACIDNGVRTPGIHDSRIDTYCKRQAIRQKYAGQIDLVTFNEALADREGLESALADAMADFQMEQSQKKH